MREEDRLCAPGSGDGASTGDRGDARTEPFDVFREPEDRLAGWGREVTVGMAG